MKEIGIIMSGDHPLKCLDGTKTMTRRTWGLEVVNQYPSDWQFRQTENDMAVFRLIHKHWGDVVFPRSQPRGIRGEEPNLEFLFKCPYGQVGDRLWVRETWAAENRYDHLQPSEIPDTAKIYYVDKLIHLAGGYSLFVEMGKIRSSMFMCRWMSRITLEITEIRAERLQEISEEDAKAEGAEYGEAISIYPDTKEYEQWEGYRAGFIELWNSLNAKRGYGWETNPWVWVISFKRLDE